MSLCYALGFGTEKSPTLSEAYLDASGRTAEILQDRIDRIKAYDNSHHYYSHRIRGLHHDGIIKGIDFPIYYQEANILSEAESEYKREIIDAISLLGTDHAIVRDLRFVLSEILAHLGRWKEAEAVEKQNCGDWHGTIPEDTVVQESLSRLANLYHWQGKFEEAEQIHKQLLSYEKQTLGEEHIATLVAMGHLAVIYNDQGKWDATKELEKKIIDTYTRLMGKEHKFTLWSMSILAFAYLGQKRGLEAENLGLCVLEKHERHSGKDHPDTIDSTSFFSLLYKGWSRELKKQYSATLNDPKEQSLRRNAAGIKEAAQQEVKAEPIQKSSNTPSLDSSFEAERLLQKAAALQVQLLDTCKRCLGSTHGTTLKGMVNLAEIHQDLGRLDEAVIGVMQAIELSSKALGEESAITVWSQCVLTRLYNDQQQSGKRQKLLCRLLPRQIRAIGYKHIETQNTFNRLMYHRNRALEQQKWDEAIMLTCHILDAKASAEDYSDASTWPELEALERSYRAISHWREAEDLNKQIIQRKTTQLGAMD